MTKKKPKVWTIGYMPYSNRYVMCEMANDHSEPKARYMAYLPEGIEPAIGDLIRVSEWYPALYKILSEIRTLS